MLRVRVVGGLGLEVDGVRIAPPAGRPARALLGWLSVHPGPHTRGAIAAALWPDVRDESARASLRTALSAVRDALGDHARTALIADRQGVELAGPPATWVDLREFDELIGAGRAAEAVALAPGEVLPELESDWVLRERDRHRDRLSTAMTQLAASAGGSGDDAGARTWLIRRTEIDPFDEGAHRDLISALDRIGDRAAALGVYERLATRLRRELAVAPSPLTRRLAASLRADEPATTAQADPAPSRRALPSSLRGARWRRAFVGRAGALARLSSAWADAKRGALAFAVIAGEPGIGKTRLAAQFAGELHAGGATVLAGAAQGDASEAYGPIAEALRGDPSLSGDAVAVPRALLDEPAARIRVQERLAGALERASGQGAALLVLDDLHWADPDTLAFLRTVARRGLSAPMLIVATSRLGELGPHRPLGDALASIGRAAPVTRIEIGGLDLSESAALVTDRPQGQPLSTPALEAVVRRTGGNPFFIEALLDAGLTEPGAELPAGVAELVAARVRALGEPVAGALEGAALLGREFDLDVATRLASLDPQDAVVALDDAAAAHLVSLVPGRAGRMSFVHALVQEALVSGLAPSRRAGLHARAVDALAARARAGSEPALTAAARHAIAALPAIDVERAAELAGRAAAALTASGAPAEAAELLSQALSACDDAGAPAGLRARLHVELGEALAASDRASDAAMAYGRALSESRRIGDGELLARSALGLAGPPVTILEVDRRRVAVLEEALDALPARPSALRTRAQARLAVELAYERDADRRRTLSSEALGAARELGDPRALAAALGARHVVLWGPDHTLDRLPLADEMVTLATRAHDPSLELQARSWRILDLSELGEGQEVDSELEAYATTAAAMPLSPYAWYVPAWRAVRACLAGDPQRARQLQRQAIRQGQRSGDANLQFAVRLQYSLSLADERPEGLDFDWHSERVRNSPAAWAYRSMSTWYLAAAGWPDEARDELAAQVRAGAPSAWPRDTNWLSATKELSEAAWLLGAVGVGAELERLLEPFADRIVMAARGMACMGAVAGALARLAELRGDQSAAIARYEHAIDRDQRAGASVWATHHRRRLGEALIAAGRHDRGRAMLARVAREAPEMGLQRVAELARARCTDRAGWETHER